MTEELITTDTILGALQGWFEHKQPVSPDVLIDASYKLNVLVGTDQEYLFELQQEIAKLRLMYIESGDSVAKAKARVEATDIYRNAKKQEAKVERIHEFIRIAKLHARMSNDEKRGY